MGDSKLEMDVPGVGSVRDVVRALGERYPGMLGTVLRADLSGPSDGYTLNLNGRSFIADLDQVLEDADVLLLIPATAGGEEPDSGAIGQSPPGKVAPG